MWDSIRRVDTLYAPHLNLARKMLNDHLCHSYLDAKMAKWFVACNQSIDRVVTMIMVKYPIVSSSGSDEVSSSGFDSVTAPVSSASRSESCGAPSLVKHDVIVIDE